MTTPTRPSDDNLMSTYYFPDAPVLGNISDRLYGLVGAALTQSDAGYAVDVEHQIVELTYLIAAAVRADERAKVLAEIEKLCEQVNNVREYGERGTPFYNGALRLARRIRALSERPAGGNR